MPPTCRDLKGMPVIAHIGHGSRYHLAMMLNICEIKELRSKLSMHSEHKTRELRTEKIWTEVD